jgi:hypothetical protein
MAPRSRKAPPPAFESYIFEITSFAPSYGLSVEHRKYADGPWWEHAEIEIDATCLFPASLAERTATFTLVADREFWTPYDWQKDHAWRPNGVGLLEVSPTQGRFYAPIAFESMPGLLTAMAHGLYRYILLYGPPLKRRKSLCTSIRFSRTIDLQNY